MDNYEEVTLIHNVLSTSTKPILKSKLQSLINVSELDLENIIENMRLYLDAPIKYDVDIKSYFYDLQNNGKYELPGLWLNASELYGLFASYQLLSEVGPGLLESHIEPIKNKLKSLMHNDSSTQSNDLDKRIRILTMAARKPNPKHFSVVASALLIRKQLTIHYAGRDRDTKTERIISPQRLVHYRDNWYIDAWCHLREELRTFSIDRITYSLLVNIKTKDIDEDTLSKHYSSSYGIFSGAPDKTAILKFAVSVAKWVADEKWHPDQNGQFDIDGCYQLEIPYRDPRELIQDILKFGADVEVLQPKQLRDLIKEKIEEASLIYQ